MNDESRRACRDSSDPILLAASSKRIDRIKQRNHLLGAAPVSGMDA